MCSSCARHVAANHDKLCEWWFAREGNPASSCEALASLMAWCRPSPSRHRRAAFTSPTPRRRNDETSPRQITGRPRPSLEPERVRDVDGPRAVPEVQGRRPRGPRRLAPMHFHGLEVAVSHEAGVVYVPRPRLRAGGTRRRALAPPRSNRRAALGAGQRSSVERGQQQAGQERAQHGYVQYVQ